MIITCALKIKKLLWAIFFVLLITSVTTTAGVYARYASDAKGSDSAVVASFDVTETLPATIELSMRPGDTKTVPIEVKNSGDVTVSYRVVATNRTGNLPLAFNTPTETIASGGTQTVTLTVSWDGANNSADRMGKVDVIELSLIAEQVD